MKLRAVCRIKTKGDYFVVEYPTPAYQAYFESRVRKQIEQNGGVMEITVADPVESDNQAFMRLFHAIRDQFARHWVEPISKVEDDLIREFGIKEGIKKRLKTDYGSRFEGGSLKSLKEYTAGEWKSFLRGVILEAAEQGIDVQDQIVEIGAR